MLLANETIDRRPRLRVENGGSKVAAAKLPSRLKLETAILILEGFSLPMTCCV
jgi:hypothetical protein